MESKHYKDTMRIRILTGSQVHPYAASLDISHGRSANKNVWVFFIFSDVADTEVKSVAKEVHVEDVNGEKTVSEKEIADILKGG